MKSIRTFVLIVVAVLLVLFLSLSIFDSPGYALRVLTLFSSDINDYQVFPSRPIESATTALEIQTSSNSLPGEIEFLYRGKPRVEKLADLLERTDTRAFIVIKDDLIIHEYYADGDRKSIHTSFSVAKSFDSALIGAAIADGLIDSVNDPVIKYLPELAGRGFDDLTIKNLLRMDTGIRYRSAEDILSPFSDDALTYYPPNLRKVALSVVPGEISVGEDFLYNNFYPLLEGLILERVTGMSVAEYLSERIWKPMGAEFSASWSLDSKHSGFEKMESGINASALDFARFGLLFLHNGNINGQQVLPEDWILESTAPDETDQRAFLSYPQWKAEGGYYGFHWWGKNTPDGSYDFMARGHLGQLIYVSPRENMVIVRFGPEPDGDILWADIARAIVDQTSEPIIE
jgi:CubicO group peptidase (beta-lactamase class C family)